MDQKKHFGTVLSLLMYTLIFMISLLGHDFLFKPIYTGNRLSKALLPEKEMETHRQAEIAMYLHTSSRSSTRIEQEQSLD